MRRTFHRVGRTPEGQSIKSQILPNGTKVITLNTDVYDRAKSAAAHALRRQKGLTK